MLKRTSVVDSNITHSTNIASALNAAQNKNADNIIAKYDVYPPDIRHTHTHRRTAKYSLPMSWKYLPPIPFILCTRSLND